MAHLSLLVSLMTSAPSEALLASVLPVAMLAPAVNSERHCPSGFWVTCAWTGRAAHIRLVWGILQLLVGLYVGFNPEISFAVLIIVLGATIFARGLFSLAHAVTHHDAPPDERLLHGLLGAVGIVIGAIIGLQPAAGGLAFMWVVGLYAVITGALLIGLAFGIGQLSKRGHHTAIKF